MAQIDSNTYIAARDALARLLEELATLSHRPNLDPQTIRTLSRFRDHLIPHVGDLADLARLTDPRIL